MALQHRILGWAVACTALCAAAPPSAMAAEAAGAGVEAAAAAVDAKVIAWRRDLHQHPELGNHETRTAGVVAAHLKALGIEVRTGVGKTGVVGFLQGGKPGPTVALRADMDALPVKEVSDLPFKSTVMSQYNGQDVGVMHACGHDSHTAILMGVAQALAAMRKDLPGSVLFIFQPAEEGPPPGEEGGATLMLKEGAFAGHKPEVVFGLHVLSSFNTGTIAVRAGPAMAESERFQIVVQGRQTHGARPWGGVDPVLAAAQIVTSLQSIVSRRIDLTRAPAVISVGRISGGVRFNIIPDQVELEGTIRTFDVPMREAIHADIKAVAEHAAASVGATASVSIEQNAAMLVNNPDLTARMRPSLVKIAGAEHTVEAPFQMPAEDFAAFANEVPGMYFFVGITPQGVDPATAAFNHSPKFFIDESGIGIGTRALLQVTIDYLSDPPARK